MKTSPITSLSAAALALGVVSTQVIAGPGDTTAIPSVPVGIMSAYPTVVQTGTKPTLNWNILYPSKVGDVADIAPPGEIIVRGDKGPKFICVQIISAGVTSGDPASISAPVDVRMKMNAGNYYQLFYGTQQNIDPSRFLYVKNLNAATHIAFGGNYQRNGVMSPFYTGLSANRQVVALVHGDRPPTNIPLYQLSNLQSAIKPYLDTTGKVSLGPLCVLIMMELGMNDYTSFAFDYQDVVLLVWFADKHPNNGNNKDSTLDGTNLDNPGGGHGGPNGASTITAGVDDLTR